MPTSGASEPFLRILHSPLEIAGQVALTAAGQRTLGHRADSFTEPHPFAYEEQATYVPRGHDPRLWKLQRIAFAPVALARYDVFHYHDGSSLVPVLGFADARLARRLHRKVVIEFWGGDVRRPDIEQAINPFYVPGPSEDGSALERIKRWMEVTEGHVVCADHFADAHLEGYATEIHVVGQRVNVSRILPRYPDPERAEPVVFHAPSNSAVKGTRYVRDAVASLQRKGRSFRFIEASGRTNREILDIAGDADIVVDQLCLSTHGIFAAEAMALGKPVICRIPDDMRSKYPPGLPIVTADPTSIEAVLDDLLHDGVRRRELGARGRQYAAANYDHVEVGRRLIDVYRSLPG